MNIVYIGSFRFPNGDPAASRVLNNVRILKALGHEVSVISFGGKDESGWQNYEGIRFIVTKDIDTHSWKERLLRYLSPYPNCKKILHQLAPKNDAVICYNQSPLFYNWLKPFCRRRGLVLVADIVEWYSAKEIPFGYLNPGYWLGEFFMYHTLNTINNRILISNYLGRHYRQGNNIILPPLVDMSDKKWQPSNCCYPDIISKKKGIKIIYAGTPRYKDSLDGLVRATLRILKIDKNIQIIIVGVSDDQVDWIFENKDDYENNKENFVFLGRIPQDEVPAYYQIADFSAIIRERTRKNMAGFPTKMAESMAAGCPVIASDFSDMACFVEDGKNGILLNGYSEEAIADGLKRILALSSEQIHSMKIFAKKSGETRFDYRNYIDSVSGFINRFSKN